MKINARRALANTHMNLTEASYSNHWGAKVIDRLSHDLKSAFPEMSGFSARNLKYMRAFAAAWPSREFSATHRCTIALAEQSDAAGKIEGSRATPLVCPESDQEWNGQC